MAWGLSTSPNNDVAVLNIFPAFSACENVSVVRKYSCTWNARGFQQRSGQKPTQKKAMFAWQRCGAVTECVNMSSTWMLVSVQGTVDL